MITLLLFFFTAPHTHGPELRNLIMWSSCAAHNNNRVKGVPVRDISSLSVIGHGRGIFLKLTRATFYIMGYGWHSEAFAFIYKVSRHRVTKQGRITMTSRIAKQSRVRLFIQWLAIVIAICSVWCYDWLPRCNAWQIV